MTEEVSLRLTVDAKGAGEAGAQVRALQQFLAGTTATFPTTVRRESNDTQDAGTILVGILSTQAVMEVARALHAYVVKNRGLSISLSSKSLTIVGPSESAISALNSIADVEGVLKRLVSSK